MSHVCKEILNIVNNSCKDLLVNCDNITLNIRPEITISNISIPNNLYGCSRIKTNTGNRCNKKLLDETEYCESCWKLVHVYKLERSKNMKIPYSIIEHHNRRETYLANK